MSQIRVNIRNLDNSNVFTQEVITNEPLSVLYDNICEFNALCSYPSLYIAKDSCFNNLSSSSCFVCPKGTIRSCVKFDPNKHLNETIYNLLYESQTAYDMEINNGDTIFYTRSSFNN
jgi:hypothetical protein